MYENGNLSAADVYAVTRNNDSNNGMWGGDWFGYLLLFALFGGGFGGFGGFGGAGILPWLLFGNGGFGGFGGGCGSPCATQADVRSAVDQQTLISKLDQQTYGLADSTYAINNAINNGFFGVQNTLCQGFNGISREVADCCCSTKSAIADVKYTIANEGCETRHALFNNTRDIIDNANANSRAILDFLVQDKLASKDARIAQLENKLSQSEQNAFISATIDASQATLIRRLGADCPTPAYVVQPPQPVTFPTNCCGTVNYAGYNNGGCGCGNF